MSEHTELPWAIGYESKTIVHEVPGMADGCEYFNVAVLSRHSLMTKEAADANAVLIVRAVNSLASNEAKIDALTKALEVLLEEAENFSVSGVCFNEECMGHKGPALARAALSSHTEQE